MVSLSPGSDSPMILWSVPPSWDGFSVFAALRPDQENCIAEIGGAVLSNDGMVIAATYPTCNDEIRLWDVTAGDTLHAFQRPWTFSIGLAISPDGSILAAPSGGNSVILWDTANGTQIHTFSNIEISFHSAVVFSPDGHILAVSDQNGAVHLFDIGQRELLRTLRGHHSPSVQVAFSPDSTTIATGGTDYSFILWDVASGERLNARNQSSYVLSLAFSPDGKTLATTTHGKIFLWDVATLELFGTLEGHIGEISLLKFSPDGNTLITSGFDHSVIFWNLETAVLQAQ